MTTLPRLPWRRAESGFRATLEDGSAFISENGTAPAGGMRWAWTVTRQAVTESGWASGRQLAADAATEAWHKIAARPKEPDVDEVTRAMLDWLDGVAAGNGFTDLPMETEDTAVLRELLTLAYRRWERATRDKSELGNIRPLIGALTAELNRRRVRDA